MAMMLPVLRLCLLLLNLYGTFKAIKPPPMSQRHIRNGQGPSGRAMQLRKREMKSRLAVWVVWAVFATLERPLDRTIGFLTPFYNELKCTILLFLIVSRSHGAEAIFLHLIHPLVRPYVPAVDNILATLLSLFELVTLIFLLPLEYALHWWHHWSWRFWSSDKDPPSSGGYSPDESDSEDKEEDRRQRLRPRNELQQVKLRETQRNAQAILQEIENAQNRVRTRTKNQLAARNNVRAQPVRETRNMGPHLAGLRTRRRVLDLNGLPQEVIPAPGSRSTGVHHLGPMATAEVARGPAPPQLPFPNTSTEHPITRLSPAVRIPTPSSSSQSSHEIWYPPQSAFEDRKRKSPSPDTAYRTPSPVYPPLPSAYRFTPRRSDPLPPPPHTRTPPVPVNPTPRRVSTGGMSRGAVDAYEGIDQFPGRTSQASALASGRLADPSLYSHNARGHNRGGSEGFFHQALEPSIQTTDVDMETLSTRDGSSANEEPIEGGGGIKTGLHDMANAPARDADGKHGNVLDSVSRTTRSGGKTASSTGPARRSARTRKERSSSVETDEFGFTIRQDFIALKNLTADSSSLRPGLLAAGQPRKKPLARTKPSLKPTQEEGSQFDSSDEEIVKKRRKLRQDVEGQPRAAVKNKHQLEVPSPGGDTKAKAGDARKKAAVQGKMKRGEIPEDVLKERQVGTRATRSSTRQPLSAQNRPNIVRRDRGK